MIIITVVAVILPFSAVQASPAAEESIPAALVVGSSDSQWTSNSDHSIVLDKGSVVIIADSRPLKVETKMGTIEIAPNLEAVIQQDNALPVTVTAIACRKTADENNPDCALTVATNDDSSYKVYPGKQLKLTTGETAEITDAVVLKQQPEVAMAVRSAAQDLAAAAFALLGDANAGNAQVITACARTLMAGSAEGPVKLYVTEGSELVALQPGTHPLIATAKTPDVKPKPKAQELPSPAPADEMAAEDHQLSKLQIWGDTEHSAWNTAH